MAVHAMRSATCSALVLALAQLGIIRMLMPKVVQKYNESSFIFYCISYSWSIDIQNGLCMPLHALWSATGSASASTLAMTWHYQNAHD